MVPGSNAFRDVPRRCLDDCISIPDNHLIWQKHRYSRPSGRMRRGHMLQESGVMVAADVVKDTTTQGFMKDVIEESKRQPVLVDFWAPWCGPCKQLTPVLEKTVKAAKGKVKLVKMNIDDHPAIPGQMG